ncbi:hypothetical protein Pla110_28690 [Polystyrenella longa]|uniref:Preprotein translocase subunit SecD n=1 Tax=Polystyrenella longa TaxID=2528007 RepID=A0A518CPI3_9PLAN|nr:hypothetical protein [Polystyrenella longa]QDU81132.1 hypothetical protein Pla110_28690 [Polystyrenella longa]
MFRLSLIVVTCFCVCLQLTAAEKPKTIETEIALLEMTLSAEDAERITEKQPTLADPKAWLTWAEKQKVLKTVYRVTIRAMQDQPTSVHIATPVSDDLPKELDELKAGFSVDLKSKIKPEGIVSVINAQNLVVGEWKKAELAPRLNAFGINTVVIAKDGERILLAGPHLQIGQLKQGDLVVTLKPRVKSQQ